jgi:3-dehydroquinate synthase
MTLVAIPFVLLGDSLDAWVEGTGPADLFDAEISDTRVLLIVAAALACDIVLPVPSGPLLTLAAVRCGVVGTTLAGGAGLSLGALAGYALGRWGGRPIAQRFATPEELDARFPRTKTGAVAMLFATRPVPIVAEATVLVAGLLKMPLGRFLVPVVAGNFAFALVMAILGGVAREREGVLMAVFVSAAAPWAIATWLQWLRETPPT